MFAGQSQRVDHGQALEPPPLHGPLAQRLGRIRGRLKALTALDGAVTGAALATAAAALLVGWCRWRARAPSPGALAAIVAAGAAAGAVARASRRISWAGCARLVDQALDGEDRVLSAVWLASASSPLARAAVADAVARTERLDPRVAVPGRRPSGTRGLAFGVVVLAIAWLVPGGTRAARLQAPHVARSPAAPLPPSALDAERAAVALARARAEGTEDAALRALAAALDRLVRGLSDGTVDEGAALEALRVLEEQAGASAAAAARDAEVLRAAAKALLASAATRDAGEALRRGSAAGEEAATALGSSAARQPAATAAALRAAADAVSQAANDSSDADSAGRRRLRRDQPGASAAAGGSGERAHGDEQRKLEQLSRDLDQAGASCENGGPDCRSRAESSGRQLGELQRKASAEPSMRELERATRQLHDRIARGDLRNGQSDAARAFAQAAAGGQPSSENAGPSGDSSDDGAGRGAQEAAGAGMSAPGSSSATGATQPAAGGADEEESAASGGIGHENGGAPLAGRESAPAPAGRDARVPTADGAGPSRAQVIDGAAGRGFATRPYAHVYADYRAAVEEALGASAVPSGQQYVVRRYFDLIRPRPSAGAGGRR